MKIKKSKFAKLLTLALPIAAISIVTPVVLTSCGSSNSTTTPDKPDNGGTGNSQSYNASWDTSSTSVSTDLKFSSDNSIAIITLGDNGFAGTNITKNSKLVDIENSLSPSTESKTKAIQTKDSQVSETKTLYSVLSSAIKNIDKFTVKLIFNTNPVVFDFSNDDIGNTFSGQFELTPINNNSAPVTKLNFVVNNFNDSNNTDGASKLTWDTDAIEKALEKSNTSTGNQLPDVKPKDNGASVTIDLTNQKIDNNKEIGLGRVMDELCGTTISTEELSSFIKGDITKYKISDATISSWAPTVDGTKVFTRIVIPNNDSSKQDAIMYLAYTGYKVDDGNAAWNRNITYIDANDVNGDLWDTEYHEPVIDLAKVNNNDLGIDKENTSSDIIKDETATKIVDYICKNYILNSSKFSVCFSPSTNGNSPTIVLGKFTNGKFSKNTMAKAESTDNSINGNAIQMKVLLKPNNSSSSKEYDTTNEGGIWRSFYIIGYKENGSSKISTNE